jgi:hypothetical protein
VERNGRDFYKVLLQHLYGGTEENNEEFQSG